MLQQHAPWPGGGRGVESDDESLDGVASPWEYPPAAAEEAAATAIQKKVRGDEVFDEIYRVRSKEEHRPAASERSYDTRVKCGFCLTYIEEGQIRVRLQSSSPSQPHGGVAPGRRGDGRRGRQGGRRGAARAGLSLLLPDGRITSNYHLVITLLVITNIY